MEKLIKHKNGQWTLEKSNVTPLKPKVTHDHIRAVADNISSSEAANKLSGLVPKKHDHSSHPDVNSDHVHSMIDHLPHNKVHQAHAHLQAVHKLMHGHEYEHE